MNHLIALYDFFVAKVLIKGFCVCPSLKTCGGIRHEIIGITFLGSALRYIINFLGSHPRASSVVENVASVVAKYVIMTIASFSIILTAFRLHETKAASMVEKATSIVEKAARMLEKSVIMTITAFWTMLAAFR